MPDDPFLQRPGGAPRERAEDARQGRGDSQISGVLIAWAIFAVFVLLVATIGALGQLLLIYAAILFPPLLLLPSLFLFALALSIVAGALHLFGVRRNLALGLGVVLVAGFSFGFPFWVEQHARQAAAALSAGDLDAAGIASPDSIEIVQAPAPHWERFPREPSLCETLCQRLLLGRQVAWVRMRAIDPAPSRGTGRGMRPSPGTYRVESRETCPPIFREANLELPETRQAMALGTCIVLWREGEDLVPAARIVIDTVAPWRREAEQSEPPSWLRWRQRIEIALHEADRWMPIARRTDLRITPPRLPLHLMPTGGDLSEIHLAIARRDLPWQPADPTDMLRSTFGFRLTAPAGDANAERATRALLARQGSAPFDEAANRVIFEYMTVLARRLALDAEDAALIRAVILDPRVTMPAAAQVLALHPQSAASMAPILLARIEHPDDSSARRTYAYLLVRLPREAWEPEAPRIARLLSQSDSSTVVGLRAVAGQLGVDPSPWMFEWLRIGPGSSELDLNAIRGICRSDPQWWASLAPILEAAIRAPNRAGSRMAPDRMAGPLLALRRIGAPGQARALFDELHGGASPNARQRTIRMVFERWPADPDGSLPLRSCSDI